MQCIDKENVERVLETFFCIVGRLSLRFSPAKKAEWRFWLVSKITIFRNHFQWVPLPAWLMKHNFFLRFPANHTIENWLISHRDFFAKCNLTLFPRFWFHPKKSRLVYVYRPEFYDQKDLFENNRRLIEVSFDLFKRNGVSSSDVHSSNLKNNVPTITFPLSALCAANLCRTSNSAGPPGFA